MKSLREIGQRLSLRSAKRKDEALFKLAVRDGMVPPQHLWHMVGADHSFAEQGEGQLKMLIDAVQLSPTSAVLDIGCGLGKLAAHLAPYLQPPGLYEGFDIEPIGLRWCNEAIASRYPHASFRLIPIKSARYNPTGTKGAGEFEFPYSSNMFDLVFLGSVFTHMMLEDVRHYIFEIARVLKPGGACVATFFLLNEERHRAIAEGTACLTFAHERYGSFVEMLEPLEAAVAQDEAKILATLSEAGLVVQQPRLYGSWHKTTNQDQDHIIARKA